MNRLKFIPVAFGIGLLLVTLVGANRLNDGAGDPQSGAGGRAGAIPKANDGLVAKGNVTSESEPMGFVLPAHLAAGRVVQVLVKNGQTVKKGDVLVKFDDWQYREDLKKADAAVQAALRQHQIALGKQEQQKILVEKAKLGVKNAEQSRDKAKEMLEAIRKKLDFQLRQLGGMANIEKAIREEPEFLKAEALLDVAENQIKEKQFDVMLAEKEPLLPTIEAATFQSQVAQADAEKAKTAIALCEMRTEIGGVIERVAVAPGQVMYPQSRTPMFWLIPDGTRFVKAEIVPEFAHKIRDKEGAKVVISDDSSPGLVYEGVVDQVGSAFLPKTGGVDLLNGKPTNVLEVSIRVVDPAPPGKPALRVGQPVRVTIP
jgi:multidrug resistance efflux pump